MTRIPVTECPILGPLNPDWTIVELLEWIAADDARCHDDALAPALTWIVAALAPALPSSGGVVSSVRWLAQQTVAKPTLGRIRLGRLHPARSAIGGVDRADPVAA